MFINIIVFFIQCPLRICTLHGNHVRMVFSFEMIYEYGIFPHIGFPNPMPIPLLYPNHTIMGTNIYRYWYDFGKNHHTSMGYHTGIVVPVRICAYGDILRMGDNTYFFTRLSSSYQIHP